MISMTRNDGAPSNIGQPGLTTYRYYEKTYTGVGPQEWIILPDAVGKSKVVISFPAGSGGAFLEGTSSPGDVIAGYGVNPIGAYSPIVYPLTDSVTDITPVLVQGETAVRINIAGGPAAISVRC